MAQSQQVTVGSTATAIGVPAAQPRGAIVNRVLRNHDASKDVYLGGPTVTTSNGILFRPLEALSMQWDQDDTIYGVVASGTAVVGVLSGDAPR